MTCDAIGTFMTTFFRSVFTPLIVFSSILLTISLILLGIWYSRIKTHNKFESFSKWFVYFSAGISLISIIYLGLSFYSPYYLLGDRLDTTFSLTLIVTLIFLFPTFFIFYYAWKKELPLALRYFVIFAYFISSILILPLVEVWTFEQIVTKRKICFGLSCSVCNNISTPK